MSPGQVSDGGVVSTTVTSTSHVSNSAPSETISRTGVVPTSKSAVGVGEVSSSNVAPDHR